jgi:hypothetical protein
MVGRASARAAFCRRVFFKSAAAPAVSETESIMNPEDEAFLNRIKLDLCAASKVLHIIGGKGSCSRDGLP